MVLQQTARSHRAWLSRLTVFHTILNSQDPKPSKPPTGALQLCQKHQQQSRPTPFFLKVPSGCRPRGAAAAPRCLATPICSRSTAAYLVPVHVCCWRTP